MDEITPVQKFLMMSEAGFTYPEPWPQYARVISFLKEELDHVGCHRGSCIDLGDKAKKLLQQLGEK